MVGYFFVIKNAFIRGIDPVVFEDGGGVFADGALNIF